MKYMKTSMSKHFANMRKQIVKFYLTLMAAMLFAPSFAVPTATSSLTYNGKSQKLIGTVKGEEYSFDGTSWSSDTLQGKNADTYTIYYRKAGVEATEYSSIEVTIAKKKIRPYLDKYKFEYDGYPHTPTFDIDSTDVYNEKVTAVATTEAKIAAGNYKTDAKLEGADAGNYEIGSTYSDFLWSILGTDAPVTCPEGITGLIYNGLKQALVTAGNKGEVKGYFEYSIEGENGPFEDSIPQKIYPGTYTVYSRFVPEYKGYYTTTCISKKVTIAPKTIDVTWTKGRIFTYNTQEQGPTPSISKSDIIGDDVVDVTVSGRSTDVVHDMTATASLTGANKSYYVISKGTDTAIYSINPAKITKDDFIAPTAKELTYTGDSLALINAGRIKTIEGYFIYGINEGALTNKIPKAVNQGDYTVRYQFKHADKNHNDSEIFTITAKIAKAKPSITTLPEAIADLEEDGKSHVLIDNSIKYKGGTIYYSLDKTDWNETLPTGTDAGEYTVYFKIKGDENHIDSTFKETVKVKIYKKSSIKLTIGDWVYGATAKTPTTTGNTAEATEIYTYYTDALCTKKTTATDGAASVGKVPTKPGIYYVTVDVAAIGIYKAASDTIAFEITKKPISIVWTGDDVVTYNGESQSLTPSLDKAEIVGSDDVKAELVEETKKDADTYTLTAKLAGENSANYEIVSGTNKTSLKIEQKTLTVTWGTTTLTYNGKEQAPEATLNGVIVGDKVDTVITGKEKEIGDTYTATISLKNSGDGKNYKIKSGDEKKSFKIIASSADFVAPLGIKNIVYTGDKKPLITAGTSTTAGKFTYNVNGGTYSEEIPNGINAGTYKIIYIFEPTDKNITPVKDSFDVKIDKADVILPTPEGKDLTYTGTPQKLIEDYTVNGGTIKYKVNGGDLVSEPTGTDAISYEIEFVFTPDNNHKAATIDPISVSIKKASITLTLSREGWTYGSEPTTVNLSGNEGSGTESLLYYTDEACTVPTTTTDGAESEGKEPTKAGTYYIKATVDATDNYEGGSKVTDFTIAQKVIGIKWGETNLTYNGSIQYPTAAPTDTLSGDDISLTVDGGQTNVGNNYVAKVVTITGTGANNYKLPTVDTTKFSISKADVTITKAPTANTLTYNASKQKLITSGSVDGGVYVYAFKGAEFTDTIPAALKADTFKIEYKIKADANHNDADGGELTAIIAKKPLDVNWGENEFTYDPTMSYVPTPTVTPIAGDSVGVSVLGRTSIPGIHEATAVLNGKDKDNYTLTATATKEFTIKNAQISKPTFDEHEFIYTGNTIEFGSENAAYTVDGELAAKEPGKYVVTITLKAGYEWSDGSKLAVKDSFLIKKINVTAPVADTKQFIYNGAAQTYTITPNDAYTVTGNVQTKADEYNVVVTLKDADHYEWKNGTTDKLNFTFTIAKKVVNVPSVETTTFVYDGNEKSFEIAESSDYIVADSNAVATNAGKYVRTIALKDNVNYLWEDKTTADTSFTFTIKPQIVKVPVVTNRTFKYNGLSHTFSVPADSVKPARYVVKVQVAAAINRGTYTDTLALVDKKNYVWEGGSSNDQLIDFTITDGTIKAPVIPLSYTYTGEEITFVPENNAYEITNGKGTNASTYTVKVTPSDGYKWEDGTKEAVTYTVKINRDTIVRPAFTVTEFTYNGDVQNFKIPTNPGYTITGFTSGTEPGSYSDTLTLDANHIWDNESTEAIINTFKINKIIVSIPEEDKSTFTYNGEVQVYELNADAACTISNNKQTDVNTYTVTASIDAAHYEWEDKTTADKTYKFVINPAKVNEPSAAQLTYTYDGTEKDFAITASDKCVINPKNKTASKVGTYERTVSLSDTINYVWAKGDKADRTFTFEIKPITIEMPIVVKSYEYTGKPIVFVPDSVAYSVKNGIQTDADSYEVTVTPNIGYAWKDETTAPKTITVVINPIYVDKPVITDTAFIYNGKAQSFGFVDNVGYEFEGDTSATEPGNYTVSVILNKNYVWEDETTEDEVFNFVISKIEVAIPVADVTKFTYTGKEQTYTIAEDSTYSIKGNVKTNVGKYVVTVALKDPLHYEWADSTTTIKTFDFSISKLKVTNPTATVSTTFIYDGDKKDLAIVENANYEIADSNAVATKTGTYIRTVSLKDTANTCWVDGTTEVKTITFTIGDGTLQIPDITLEYDYTGDTIVFIPNDEAYTLVNGAKREAGTYNVSVTPNPGYRWSDSTKTTKTYIVTIKPIVVNVPEITTGYTYNKKTIDFKIPVDENYSISGETNGVEIGTYKVSLTLKANCMWSDSTTAKKDYLISINKRYIPIPAVDTTLFVYNGKRQTYAIAKSTDYKVLDNVQTYAGTYDVTLILLDYIHYAWSDSTVELKTYTFDIARAQVELPTAEQDAFVFDGKTKYFAVTDNNNYEVASANASATEVGTYVRTVTLKDTLNYTWVDSTTTAKTVTFLISDGTVETPEVKTEYTYNGSPFSFVPENPAYTVENGVQTETGTYTVTVTLKSGYVWDDKTSEAKTFEVVIKPAKVEKPEMPTNSEYTYTGEELGFEIAENDGYSVSGITKAIEPGTYNVEVSLNPNYIWSDSTTKSLTSTIIINKVVVEIPAAIDSIFTYNGEVQTYEIPDTIASYNVSGHHRSDAGNYIVSVTLSDTLHYLWNDSTIEAKKYDFIIKKTYIEIPEIGTSTFVYNGGTKKFNVSVVDSLVDSVYVISGPVSASKAGKYDRTLSLSDTINFAWTDSTIENKVYHFMIAEGMIPTINDTTVVYTGKNITFVPADSTYSVENGSATNVGTYFVTVTPKTGYSWEDGTYTAKLVKATITPKEINKPKAGKSVFDYDGKKHNFSIQIGDSCTLSGDTTGIEPGIYEIVVTPGENFAWKNGSVDEIIYKFTINRISVEIPAKDPTKFTFNNEEQEYNIPESKLYTVSGNIQKNEGSYNVTVALNDTVHYEWTDSTIADKTYKFVIEKSSFKLNELTQLNDGSINSTPGGYAILDIDSDEPIYEYTINCPECPAFNDTLKAIDSKTNQINILIPDTVKPGIYELTVTLKSGSFEKKTTLKLAVNYPASKIVVCWSNVLMVDNSSKLFKKYQWYKDGEIIKGATSQYYQDKDGLNGTYYCEVNDSLIVGPAFFNEEMPLSLKARAEEGAIIADVTGKTDADIVLMNINGLTVGREPAGKNVRFEGFGKPGIYILNLEGTKLTVKVIVE